MANPKPDFESAVEADYAVLARAATVLCRSKSDVEDVLQETMLRAFNAYPSFRGGSSFLTWAYTILARVAQARNLSAARCIPEAYALSQPEHLPPVDRAIVMDEEHRCLIDAIRALPERQREMVTLHFLQEVSYDEIAQALGVTVGTVKATVFQAKATLRSTLAKKGIRRKATHVLS